jgi:hypothetical protein
MSRARARGSQAGTALHACTPILPHRALPPRYGRVWRRCGHAARRFLVCHPLGSCARLTRFHEPAAVSACPAGWAFQLAADLRHHGRDDWRQVTFWHFHGNDADLRGYLGAQRPRADGAGRGMGRAGRGGAGQGRAGPRGGTRRKRPAPP